MSNEYTRRRPLYISMNGNPNEAMTEASCKESLKRTDFVWMSENKIVCADANALRQLLVCLDGEEHIRSARTPVRQYTAVPPRKKQLNQQVQLIQHRSHQVVVITLF